jgi:hypothetical protein
VAMGSDRRRLLRFKRRNAKRRSSACRLMGWGFGRLSVAACRTHGRELMCTPRSAFLLRMKRESPRRRNAVVVVRTAD